MTLWVAAFMPVAIREGMVDYQFNRSVSEFGLAGSFERQSRSHWPTENFGRPSHLVSARRNAWVFSGYGGLSVGRYGTSPRQLRGGRAQLAPTKPSVDGERVGFDGWRASMECR